MNLDLKFIVVVGISVFTVRSEEAPKCENEDSFSIFSHIDCSRFWQCSGGQAVLWKCPTGLYFNKNINVCDSPENVDCSYNNSDNDNNEQDGDTQNNNDDNNEENGDTRNSNDNNNEEDEDKHIINNKNKKQIKHRMNNNNEEDEDSQNNDDDDNNNELDEDKQNEDDSNDEQDEDMNSYNGIAKEQDGDRRNNNDNNNKEDGDTQNNNNNEQDDHRQNNNDSNEYNYDLVECEGIECPAKDGNIVAHIFGPDCTKFCKCFHGVAYLQTCPPGLFFNSVLQVCDFPESPNCVQKDDLRENKEKDDDGNDIDKNNQENSQPEQCDDVECPLEDANSVFYKPGPDCTTFCKCYRGIAYLENCPADLYFNPTLAVCDFQDNSGCVNNNDNVPDNVDNKIPDIEDNKIPDDVDNDEDGSNEMDDYDEIVCLKPCIEEDGLSPASSCNNFCLCSNGEQHIMTCPDYLEFNAQYGFCDWPGNSGCQKN